MSFTAEVERELIKLPIKKTCCRRAVLLGMLLGARNTESGEHICYFYEESVAEQALDMLKRIFHAKVELSSTVRAGRKTYKLTFASVAVSDFLKDADRYNGDIPPHTVIGFRCSTCQSAFVRGVFLGTGSVTDPHKGYHLELTFPTEGRADLVAKIITDIVGKPNRIKRGERYALYYKNNGAILDLLYFIGSNQQSLNMANSFIERDIRNNENRATNCVARNISRSVGSAQKQINAILALKKDGRFDALPQELRTTASLRLENESASLLELSLMHEPPISKSGLNRRLQKLIEKAKGC